MKTAELSTVAGSRGVVTRATLEHERNLYTGILLALLFTPKRCGLRWRDIAKERVRTRAHGPQEAEIGRYGRVLYPVF